MFFSRGFAGGCFHSMDLKILATVATSVRGVGRANAAEGCGVRDSILTLRCASAAPEEASPARGTHSAAPQADAGRRTNTASLAFALEIKRCSKLPNLGGFHKSFPGPVRRAKTTI